ncbi:kinase-like domain-containing protein [Armillaria mellea]|nr:kinase-like domain-containing protein [Armillaria mellea]
MNAFTHFVDYFGPPAPQKFETWLQRHMRRRQNPFWRTYFFYQTWASKARAKLFTGFWKLWRRVFGRWMHVKMRFDSRVEVASMRFIATNTSVPVPKIWLQFRWRELHYVIMQRAPGQCLAEIWPDLQDEAKLIIVEQLAQYIREIRSISPPTDTRICSVLGGPIRNFRMHDDGDTGPFRDEAQLNLQLRRQHPVEDCAAIVAIAHAKSHPLVFTHGDLVPRNIMVQGTEVTAILDWECAGWYPAHTEYCMAMNWENWNLALEDWRPWIRLFVPIYELEAEADRALLSQYFVPVQHVQ